MAELFAYLAGLLLTVGVYLVLQKELIRMVFGIVLLGNALNLGILVAGRVHSSVPPIVPVGASAPVEAVANPLPQALVLTALVISFGLTAFALALIVRVHEVWGTSDLEALEQELSGSRTPAEDSLRLSDLGPAKGEAA